MYWTATALAVGAYAGYKTYKSKKESSRAKKSASQDTMNEKRVARAASVKADETARRKGRKTRTGYTSPLGLSTAERSSANLKQLTGE